MHVRLASVLTLLSCAAFASPSLANPGGGFSWSFQTTPLNATNTAANVTVAMRNGLAWPVVVTDSSAQNGYGASATLFATTSSGVGSPASNWQSIGTGFYSSSPGHIRAASSPDGRVAFAAADFSTNGLGGRVSSATGGWVALPAGTKAVAFDSAGTLYTATSTAVSGVGGYTGAPIIDIAVSPAKEVGVVSTDMKYWQYSAWLGSWTSATLSTFSASPESQDVEFDSLGRPHVIATISNSLVAFDFNTVTGAWTSTTIASNVSPNTRAALAANADGTVGTAYVDANGLVVYAYKHDLDNWASAIVTSTGTATSPGGQVGIAYDYADLPVLAYRAGGSNNSVILAYDPVVVPEPAALSLAAVGLTLLARRRRRA